MSRPPLVRAASSTAHVPRILLPVARCFHVFHLPFPAFQLAPPSQILTPFILAFSAAVQRLELSRDPRVSLAKLRAHRWTLSNTLPYVFLAVPTAYSFWVMTNPGFPLKLTIPLAYIIALLLPITSQFVLPATPVFAWLVTFFAARFIPSAHRPGIHVNLLPALETVMYGANISDLQTRYTNPIFDIIAWLPYGILHFSLPFVVALILWAVGPKGSIQYWGRAFGFMNLCGVLTQIVLPCAAPWYEIIHGLTPANYGMPGSPGGLLRIDRIFHSQGYANTFGHAPLVFGAFPSLHSGCAVMEALFLSHFFPGGKAIYWGYVGVLWWATMYLSHHYLIDLTGGACLSVLMFYLFMPEEFKDSDQIVWRTGAGEEGYVPAPPEMDLDEEIRKLEEGDGEEDDVEAALPSTGAVGTASGSGAGGASGSGPSAPKQKRSVSWGQNQVIESAAGAPSPVSPAK